MTPNSLQLIEKFYFGFASGNIQAMHECYHPEVVFKDPVFGELVGKDARDMWKMLLEKSQGQLEIRFSKLKVTGLTGTADWRANYTFSRTKRPIENLIRAQFEFKDGLIFRHEDQFNLYQWSKQAFGIKGVLLGWTPFFKKGIHEQAIETLHSFQRKNQQGFEY